ncbi:hypothetical protein [Bacillus pseudomycoides]|uniref:hypothetical protein n=1 Tax=Bacillus pseudomycoides TaxID=64104 RepID=UPI000BF95B1B|nr:hypothetical protein [Bacillus pseudomycoides]PEP86080.1 hypothetical protein CN584_08460 [Bacillus pseudomycoides]PGE00056.1 hypothetical protein COM50_07220 [Bacillus pseudomycoides]
MFAQTKSGSSLPSEDSQQSLESVMCPNEWKIYSFLLLYLFLFPYLHRKRGVHSIEPSPFHLRM